MQERQFERLGGAATIHTDVRVICATHRNLIEMVDKREFRADLFYRLSVFPVELPPLRNRPEDIRLLVHHFAMDYAARMRKRITGISEEFMAALVRHSWPGNVRELQNLIERSVILSTGPVLSGSLVEPTGTLKLSAAVTLEEAERSHILQTLQQTEGVVGGRDGAAARLGLPRTTLIFKMKRLGINCAQRSASPMRAAASVPISGDPIFRIPPLSEISHEAASPANPNPQFGLGSVFRLVDVEREHISKIVEMTNGLIAGEGGAAEVLGVPPSTLRSRMKKLGIKSSVILRQA
jgi:formate hydrogenlyase transcriptional activator